MYRLTIFILIHQVEDPVSDLIRGQVLCFRWVLMPLDIVDDLQREEDMRKCIYYGEWKQGTYTHLV
jgi:hypothetical protein